MLSIDKYQSYALGLEGIDLYKKIIPRKSLTLTYFDKIQMLNSPSHADHY